MMMTEGGRICVGWLAVYRKPHPHYVIEFSECLSLEKLSVPLSSSVPISTLNMKGRDGGRESIRGFTQTSRVVVIFHEFAPSHAKRTRQWQYVTQFCAVSGKIRIKAVNHKRSYGEHKEGGGVSLKCQARSLNSTAMHMPPPPFFPLPPSLPASLACTMCAGRVLLPVPVSDSLFIVGLWNT